jgi:hypothetical protein
VDDLCKVDRSFGNSEDVADAEKYERGGMNGEVSNQENIQECYLEMYEKNRFRNTGIYRTTLLNVTRSNLEHKLKGLHRKY